MLASAANFISIMMVFSVPAKAFQHSLLANDCEEGFEPYCCYIISDGPSGMTCEGMYSLCLTDFLFCLISRTNNEF